MSVTKTCRRCSESKPVEEFNRATTNFGGDGYTKDCKACRVLIREERRAARGSDEAPPEQQPEDANQPKLAVPYCMPVDAAFDGTDFVLTQDNDGTEMTIYLAPHALRRIWEWAEGLALQQKAQEGPSA